MASVELIATAPMGLEALVAREVRSLGYEAVTVDNGKVTFTADAAAICRANLWLRTSDRVLLKLGEFQATTFEALFEGTRALPWPDWLPADALFPVNGRSLKSQLSSVPACQAIVKKAVVEKLKQRHGQEWFPETGPRFTIEVSLLKDIATLTVDTSGAGLHKRGYRKLATAAPLKETMAAALIQIARWFPDRPLLDPCCGSGTIPLEAALIGLNVAPGLQRTFDAEAWPRVGPDLWQAAREEAMDLARWERQLAIAGSDIDPAALDLARHHAREAGLSRAVTFRQAPAAEVQTDWRHGFLITNPPYGERLGEEQAVLQLYRELGQTVRRLQDWGAFVLTANHGFERAFGRRAERKRKLYNGRIECQYYQYPGPRPPRPQTGEPAAEVVPEEEG